MNSLNKKSDLYYIDQFDAKEIEIYSPIRGGWREVVKPFTYYEYGYLEIDSFGIYIRSENGKIKDKLISQVKEILLQITKFDQHIRTISNRDPRNEQLTSIEIMENYLALNYVATYINIDSSAYFMRGDDHLWKFDGFV